MKDNIKMKGKLKIVLRDKDGNIKDKREVNNLVVDAGKDYIAQRMSGDSSSSVASVMSHMAVGTGSTSAAAGDTTLGTELDRNALDSTTVTDNDVVYVATYAAGDATGSLTEAGIFNASTGGDMLCRTVFPTVTKGASDSLSISWTVTVG